MPNDSTYFEDAPDTESPAEDQSEGGEESENQTALLPKSFFGDKELAIGNECKVKVEKIMDDEVQVSYVPHGTKEEDMGESEMPSKDEMAGMMEDMG